MWLLKTPDGVFNAENDAQLLDWAKKGRVQPSYQASNDNGATWQKAADLEFLDMRWSIDIGDGSLHGPINRVAAEKLMASGRIPANARLLGPAKELLAQITALEREKSALSLKSAATDRDKAAAEAEVAVLKNRLETVENEKNFAAAGEIADLKRKIEAAEAEKNRLATALDAVEARLAAAETRIADAKAAEAKAKEALEDAQRQNFELTGELERLPSNAAENADNQAAIYALMQAEAEEVDGQLEELQKDFEAAQALRQARQEKLLARRRELITRLGTGPADMASRALSSRREDPRMQHLRQELDAMRILQEKGMREANIKIDDLTARLRERVAENERLRSQNTDVATLTRRIADLTQRLAQRDKELMDERRIAEEARERAAAVEQTLTARIAALENGLPGISLQSREARANNSRFPPWMGLKS